MSDESRRFIILGPQPEFSSLQQALVRLDVNAPVALITAGWQEDEPEDAEVKAAIDRPVINLRLFERSEQLFAGDQEMIQLLQDRQDELRHLRDAYRIRLDHALLAAQEMLVRTNSIVNLDSERESAIEMVRMLDRQYFVRTSQICDKYESRLRTPHRPLVTQHRREIEKVLHQAGLIVISGGHAAIILNRLRIFGILECCPHLPVIAWSGGAMALADQIVFFHDSPPQGAGNAELLRAGMSLIDNVLPLPDARTRLQLEDRVRVEIFSRRFKEFKCVVFDDQTILDRENGSWWSSEDGVRLGEQGELLTL